jgi:hypothetical protein
VLNTGIGCIYSGAGAIDVAYRRDAAPANVPLQVFLPAWTRNLMRADLTAQEPGDAVLGISDAELSRYLSARGLAVTWTLDGETGQAFGTQASGLLVDFPAAVVAYVFPSGAFVFADGGTLDLDVVRDSALNAANDFETLFEQWEMVVRRVTVQVLARVS